MQAPGWGALWAPGRVSSIQALQAVAVAFVVAAVVFLTEPQLDIAAAHLFYNGHNGFVGRTPQVEIIRNGFKAVYIAAVIAVLAALGLAHWKKIKLLGLCSARWLVVALTLTVGPGLVANVLMKDHMGRARPSQTQIFGGKHAFTPALVPAAECAKNCSFVSGEASSMFALFFGFAVVTGPFARRYFALGLLSGGAAGLIRMAQGAHFLSDVVFAGIFMAMTAVLLRIVIIDQRRTSPAGMVQ